MTGEHMSRILSSSRHLLQPRRQVLKGREFSDMAAALSQVVAVSRTFCDVNSDQESDATAAFGALRCSLLAPMSDCVGSRFPRCHQ